MMTYQLGHDGYDANLSHQRGLAPHVWSCNQDNLTAVPLAVTLRLPILLLGTNRT